MARVEEVKKYQREALVECWTSVTCSNPTDPQPALQSLDCTKAYQDIHKGVQISSYLFASSHGHAISLGEVWLNQVQLGVRFVWVRDYQEGDPGSEQVGNSAIVVDQPGFSGDLTVWVCLCL